jgi:hypothetical protein
MRLFNRLFSGSRKARKNRPSQYRRPLRPAVELLEQRELLAAFTPGNLVVLQAGDTNQYNTQGALYLNEYPTTVGGAMVQQAAIPATGTVGGTGNQPITIDLTAAAGNGELNRTADGAGLVFGGVDSTVNNGGLTLPQTPTGTSNRVIAVVGSDPAASNFVNTTTYGPFYIGDDNRGGIALSLTGPVYSFGHPNQAGGAVSQGVLYFPGPNGDGSLQPPGTAGIGPQSGVQVSSETNIRGGFIGFDGRAYWTTAGSTALGTAGIYTSTVKADPTGNSPGLDQPIVKALFTASKVGGMFLADMNGDGIVDNGDRIYLLDDGTVGGAGTGGLYMSVFDTTRWGGSNAVAGQAAGWSPMVRIAEGVIDAQPTPQTTAQLRGLAGTVLANGTAQLYASEFDNVAGNNSYILGWNDNTPGVIRIASATHTGTTATITTQDALPSSYTVGTWVSVNSVGTTPATAGGFNGVWQITAVSGNTFSYTDGNTLVDVTTPQGVTDLWLNSGSVGGTTDPYPAPAASQIFQTFADGTLTASASHAQDALRGVAFAPVAATTLTSLQVNGGSSATVSPGTNVTFTVHVANPETGVTLTGLKVTFIDLTTNSVIGQGTIDGSGNATFTTTTPLVGNHTVSAYFAGGGAQALSSASSGSTVQVNEAGSTSSSTTLALTIGGSATTQAAIGRTVTLTATPTSGATGTVSFYNGTVTPANLIGSATISSGTAVLNTSFSTAGTLSLSAVYNGDNTFASSQSTGQSLTVAANATAAITTSANNVAVGATPTYTATLTGALGAAAGTVQFFLDGAALGTAQTLGTGGAASVTSTTLTAGGHLITISYTPATTSPYNAFTVNTFTSTSGVALIETAKQAIAPGDLIAIQRGDGTTNLGSSGYLVSLAEYTTAGVLVQRIYLPNADSGTTHALLLSGQNGAEGLAQRSGNGQFITVVGYDTPVGNSFETSTQPYQFPRTIARIDANGNVDTSTAISTTQTPITGASWASGVATITAANNLQVGDPVTVANVSPSGYNGTFTVLSATSTGFTYALATNPGTYVSGGTATGPSVPFNPEDVVTATGNQFWVASSTGTGDTTDSGILFTTLGSTTATQIGPVNHGAASVNLYNLLSGPQLAVVSRGGGELGAPQGLDNVGTGAPSSRLGNSIISTLTDDSSGNVTVTTTSKASFAVVGSQVVISGASVAGYNGSWTVTGVNGNTFTFSGAPASLAAGTGGEASAGQQLTGFPNLEAQYEAAFPTGRSPEAFAALNTADGTDPNPNLIYLADQAFGLLKFWLGTNTISTLTNDGSGNVTVATTAAATLAVGDQVQISGASIAAYNGLWTVGSVSGSTFTFSSTTLAGVANATGGKATAWHLGQLGTEAGGEKFVFSGGATGVVASIVSPGTSTASVKIFVTGSNVQQANPNQIASFTDANGAPAGTTGTGVDQGFSSGSFATTAFTGGAQGAAPPTSFNGNMNFGGLAFAPGAPTTTTVTTPGPVIYGNNVTFTATITAGTGGVTPTGTVSFYDGINFLGTGTISTVSGNQVATFTTTNFLSVGHHLISAVFNPGGAALVSDAVSTGTVTQVVFYDPPAVDLITPQVGFSSPIASMSVSGSTVTVTTSEFLPFALNATGLFLTIAGNSGTNVNGTYPITLLSQNSFSYTAIGTPTAGTSGMVSVGASFSISSVAVSGSVVTVTLATAAGFTTGQQVTISGNSGTNINGTFTLTGVNTTAKTLTYVSSGAVAGTGGTAASAAPLSGNATATYLIDNTVFSVATTGTPVTISGSGAGTTVTVTLNTTSTDFVVGEEVTVAGTTGGANINGTFVITAVSGATFTYASPNAVAPTSTANSTATGLNANNTIYLPTATTAATISTASWSISTDQVTVTTSAAHNLQAGQLVTIAGVTPSTYNGTFTILSVPTPTTFTYGLLSDPGTFTSGGTALVDQGAFTEGGTSTTQGYITNSLDGHSLTIGGFNQTPGGSTTATNVIGVLGPDGSFNDSTQMPSAAGGARAVISPDGMGFFVATGTGVRYVAFGGTTPSAITAATWANTNGGTATITAPNSYVAGQTVVVSGIAGTTGGNFNGTFVVLSASSTQFTYFLATQPTGTPTFTGATSVILQTLLSQEANNLQNNQFPSTVTIGTDQNGALNQLLFDAGTQFQTNGTPSMDGPAEIGGAIIGNPAPPTTGGQPISVYGNGTGTNFPNSTDRFGNFPTSAQFAISPDGNTIIIADSRTDGLGGILEYFQVVPGTWRLLGQLQLDSFGVTGASESGTTVTVTTSSQPNFFVGESVAVNGVSLAAYDGTFTVTSVGTNSFTYTGKFTNLASSGVNVTGAFAVGSDGGMRGLNVDFTDNGANDNKAIAYITTTATNGNRLIEITGITTDGSIPSLVDPLLGTAAPGTGFRGVGIAPVAPGTTATTTTVSASGFNLNATVTGTGATGWVEFFQVVGGNNVYIGAGSVQGGTATLSVQGLLPAGSYTVFGVYTGNKTFAPSSSSTVSATIAAISTSTTVSFSPSTVGTGQSDTITATITVPAGQAPTGLVTFTNTTSSTTLGFATVNQVIVLGPTITFVATLTVPPGTFTAGTFSISASYSGNAYFASSSGSGSLSVVNSTTTTVTSSLSTPDARTGTAITLTADVTSAAAGTIGGTVQFSDGTLALGAPVTVNNGIATLVVDTSLVQSVTVTSASAATVSGTTTVTLTTDANSPMMVGESVKVVGINNSAYNGTFTVTAVSGNTFSYVDNAANGAATITSPVVNQGIGEAIGLNVLTPGMHSLSATYTPTGASLTSFAPSIGVHEQTVGGLAFAAGDVYQERNGDGITPLNTQSPNPALGSIGVTVYIDEVTPNGTLVQSLALPTADSQQFSISAASETGTTVTITTASPTDYLVGQTVTIAGITPAGYDGDFVITGVSGNTFTYTAAASLGTATVTGATAQGVVHAVVGDGQQSPTGQMSLSGDGQYLFVSGYDNNPLPFGTALPVPTANGSQNVPRSIARIDSGGTVLTEAFSTSLNFADRFNIFNGVYSPDGNQVYISSGDNGFGPGGIFYLPALVQSASLVGSIAGTQIASTGSPSPLGLEAFGGNLYAIGGGSGSGTSANIWQVGTGLPKADVSTITNATWATGTATITATNDYTLGQTVTIAGITGATGFNGTFVITGASPTSFTYALATQPTGTPAFTGATASLQAVLTQLSGIPVNTTNQSIPIFNPVDAYFTHTNGAGSSLDTVYIADRGANFGAGDITKWTLQSVNISSITETGTTATVTLASGALNLVAGEVVNLTLAGNVPTAYNGTFTVTVVDSTHFTFTAPSGTGNSTTNGTASGFVEAPAGFLYSNAEPQLGFYWLAGVTNPTTGAVTLYSTYGNGGNADFGPGILYSVIDNNGFGNAPGVPVTAASWSGGVVTITTNNNNFKAGNFVDVVGITPSGYNGLFTILSATPTSFTYALATNPGTATSVTGAYADSSTVVNTVAYEGPGGGFVGNETTRGVAVAPKAQPTTSFHVVSSALTPNGVVLNFSAPVDQTTADLYSSALTITAATWSSSGGGTATITTDLLPPLGYVVGQSVTISGMTPSGFNGTFVITSASGNTFSYALATNPGTATSFGHVFPPADVTLVGASTGPIRGSLVIDPTNPNVATFMRTDGLLPPDSYTVTVTTQLKGIGGLTLSSNYSNNLIVASPGSPVLSVPSFARGPGQTVNVPNTSSGIPVTVTGTTSVSQASFSLTYDPTLLTIPTTGAVTLSSGASGAGLAVKSATITPIDTHHSALVVSVSGGSGWTLPTSAINAASWALINGVGTVTITTSAAHGFLVGQTVTITGMTPSGYNGTFAITSVPSATQFTYTLATNPGTATAFGSATDPTLLTIAATVPASAPYFTKAVLNLSDVQVNSSTATAVSGVDAAAYFGDTAGIGKIAAQDASLVSQVAVGSASGFSAYKDLDPVIIGDIVGTGALAAQSSSLIRQAAVGTTVAQLPTIPTGSATITAATWASGTVTITVQTAPTLAYTVGQTVTISGMTPSGYNGTFIITSVGSSTSFTYALATNPGTATAFGTAANSTTVSGGNAGADPILFFENLQGFAGGTFTVSLDFKNDSGATQAISSLDEGILFDPTKYTVSNVQTGSLLTTGGAQGWSTTANVDNSVGFIRVAQSTSNPTPLADGVTGTVLTFSITVNSSLTPGTTVPLNLAHDVSSNGSTTTTDVNTNAGPLTLNPAPTNASNDAGVDGTVTIVGPNGKLAFPNRNATSGSTFTESLLFTNGIVPLNVSSLDEGILFDPAVLQVVSVSTGTDLASATGWSTTSNFDNSLGFIRVAQSTSNPTAVAGGAVLDVLDIVFKVNGTANGTTVVNLAHDVSSNGSTSTTDVNQNAGPITLNPAPTNAATDPVDGTITVVLQPNQPPFDKLPPASALPPVLFNPASISGLHTATPNAENFNTSATAITVSDAETGNVITSATESGTTVTITTAAPVTGLVVGQNAVIRGVAVAGYNGTFAVTAISGNTFTYTASASGLANSSGGIASTTAVETTTLSLVGSGPGSGGTAPVGSMSATAVGTAVESTNGTAPVAITAASWAAGVATITLGSAPGYLVGQSVTITGMTPVGYNGTFNVTSVAGNTFTFSLSINPGTATAFGTAVSGLAISGDLADLNATLAGLRYTPGPGFFGTATLTVSTDDNGNSGFGGPTTDTRSTSITVVGLFLSEINLSSTSNLATPSANQYLEIFSTVPSFTIPSNVYVVGIQGNNSTVTDIFGNSTANTPGDVTDVFKLGGFVTGSNGYLALLQKGQTYPAADIVSAGTVVTNSGTQAGFGNGGGSSVFGSLTGVHTGQDQNGVGVRLGTNPDLPGDGATAAGELSWDMPMGSSSYLLVQAPTTPSVQTGTTTATNIDGGSTATATVAGGSVYNSWNVLDGVSILASPLTPTGGGTYTQNGPDRSYAPLTFQSATNVGTLLGGANLVTTGTTSAPWTANFLGRISQNTGSSSADWLASVLAGTAPNFTLGTNTSTTAFVGQPLNSIGGPNFWADQMKLAVNDGTSSQHSQVSELTLTFASPVRLAGTADRFQITSAVDNGSAAGTATVTTSIAHDFLVGQTINIVGVTGTGWNGNKVVTAVTATTITFARGTIAANGTTSSTSFAQATGSLSTSFRNTFSVLSTATITSLTESGTTVTVTTAVTHFFTVGQQVTISNASVSGYNGTFTITAVTGNTFTYTAASSGLANATGGTASVPVNLVFTIPTGGGTYVSATGIATNVTVLVVKFLATGNLTVAFTNADPLGNKVGLNDGNYFLNTNPANVTDGTGHQLDGAHTGTFGTPGHDEFWRLFGDVNGTRFVDALSAFSFGKADGTSNTAAPVSITAASWANGVATITANNSFVVGQRVVIAGITGATGFNGTFIITSVTATSFTYALATQPSGTPGFSGATASNDVADYVWYLDANEDGNIDVGNTADSTLFFNNRYGINGGIHHLQG